MDDILIRDYRDGDEFQINPMYNKEYKSSRNVKQFNWEFKNGPSGKSIYVVAEHQNKIIALQALLPIELNINGSTILSAKSEETLVDNNFRGKGVSKLLWGKCWEIASQRKIKMAWGIGNAVNASVKSGFQPVARINHAFIVLDGRSFYRFLRNNAPKSISNNFLKRLLPFGVFCFSIAASSWFRINSWFVKNRKTQYKIENIQFDDERLVRFRQNNYKNSPVFMIEKTPAYLKWRFFDNPFLSSCILAVSVDNTITGYIILSVNTQTKIGYICDLCVSENKVNPTFKLLLTNTLLFFRNQRIAFVNSIFIKSQNPLNKNYIGFLRRLGSVFVPSRSFFMVKNIENSETLKTSTSPDSWFVNTSFTEGIK